MPRPCPGSPTPVRSPAAGAGAERIGLFGGTFDPPHAGHLAAAESCRQALSLDRVLLVVANRPWQKEPSRTVTPAEDRLAMVEAAAAGLAGIRASRIEIDRGGASYTVDTVAELRSQARRAGGVSPEIFLVVGADLTSTLSTWQRFEELRTMVTLAVVARPGSDDASDPPGWRVVRVEGRGVDVSSSEVRALLEAGVPVTGLLPDAVIRYIRAHGLYAGGR